MKKPLLIVFAVFCTHFFASAQTNTTGTQPKDVVSKLKTLSESRVIEKAYLHFDKPYYDPGDTIYFKAYVTAGERHELSKISGVLHVDLLSRNDSIMQSIILQLNNGQAPGDFALPAYVTKGNYRIRAYTQWMQNTGNKYIFDKSIPVTGRNIAKARSGTDKTDVQFFAEGGNLVSGLPSKVSFKAIGADGMGINIKGTVIDNLDKEVTKFNTAHLGMGQFYITPEGNKTYRAKVTYPDGKTGIIDLPKHDAKGITLTVNNDAVDKLSIEMNANKAYYLENKNKEITVVIYNGGIAKTVKTVLDNQVLGFDLPKKDLRTGVVQVTLFLQGMPANERLAFIQNADMISLNVNVDRPVYVTRGKVQVSMNAKGGDAQPATGYFSASVINESTVKSDDNAERNILSDLLLSTEVTGYVEQPGYYFNNVNADTRKNLDILMLTQGYRRYVWKELIDENPIAGQYKPESTLQISGSLLNAVNEPVAGGKLILMAKQSGMVLNTVTDGQGRFVFNNISYLDKTNFLLRLENVSAKSKTHFVLDKTYNPLTVTPTQPTAGKLSENLPEFYERHTDKIKVLHTVNVTDKKVYRSSNLAGSGNADQVITRNSFKNAPTLTSGLNGVARGVQFENGKAFLISKIVGRGEGLIPPMLIVVDGTINTNSIDAFNPNDVETVEVLRGASTSIYGMAGAGGVLIINTRSGGESDLLINKEMSPGLSAISPQGFYVAREFYSPNILVSRVANASSTVMWKPYITTDKDGNATFDFNNTALPGTYRIVVEGIDTNGNLGRSVVRYTVQ